MSVVQHYPDAFNGIVVGAPGMNLALIISNMFWPQQFMNEQNDYPPGCETDAILHAAISACDDLDQVPDGIVSDPDACLDKFDPFEYVGTEITCWNGEKATVSESAAAVIDAAWKGITGLSGKPMYHGFAPGTNLTDGGMAGPGLLGTECSAAGECHGVPNPLGPLWLSIFGAKDPDFEVGNLTRGEYLNLVRLSVEEQSSFFGTDSVDLSLFQEAGAKLISWHGLVSQK